MKTIARAAAAALMFAIAGAASAAPPMPPTKFTMEACMFAALKTVPGRVLGIEFGTDNETPMYEFNIRGKDGRVAEVECSAVTGLIVEVEFENADIDLNEFFKKAKISDRDAVRIALKEVPGTVVEIEHEMTQSGSVYYEVVIRGAHTQREVEVDAVSGRVVEIETQIYEVGGE